MNAQVSPLNKPAEANTSRLVASRLEDEDHTATTV
jgi:hypothetical protein